jgi:hypothetical protein
MLQVTDVAKDFIAADTNDERLLTAEEIEAYMRKGR